MSSYPQFETKLNLALKDIQEIGEFEQVLKVAEEPEVDAVWTAALTGFTGHEYSLRFWFALYGSEWDLDKYNENTVVDSSDSSPAYIQSTVS